MSKELEKFVTNKAPLRSCYYIASPYDHPDPAVMAQRVENVTKAVLHIIENWTHINPFSPVIYTSQLVEAGLKTPKEGWYHFDLSNLKKADALFILELDGWQASTGISIEIGFALGQGLPIYRYTLDELLSSDGQIPICYDWSRNRGFTSLYA